MFDTLIVQPIFNLLVFIYALLPGHNFGLAIILFTVVVRVLMWPLVKKQLHHAKAMRTLQPELKRIKKEAKGNRQQEQMLLMELYKERQINPFSSIGLLIVQFPIFIGLYIGLKRLVDDNQAIIDFSYPFVRELGNLKELAADISKFDSTLFGVVDLTQPAIGGNPSPYLPALLIVLASALIQYYQSKQLMPVDKDARSLRQILSEAGTGKEPDQTEVSAAVGQVIKYFLPLIIIAVTIQVPSALSLYWLVSGLVAYWQQQRVLGQDEQELEALADKAVKKDIIEGEVVATDQTKTRAHKPAKKSKKSPSAKKRRKRS